MAKSSKTKPFSLVSETEVQGLLTDMEKDSQYNTQARYIADTAKYPTNVITFAEQHLEHLRKFPDVNPYQYISNLKLMTKL